MKKYVIAGISTEVGKTLISAMVVEGLEADYWKPVQAGDLHCTDTMKVKSLVSNPTSVFHKERYSLQAPMSPHASAALEDIQIKQQDFAIPTTDNTLIIELAGGLMVPLNQSITSIDLLKQWQLPIVLVASYYLGSINHTLLSIEAIKQAGLPLALVVFNGKPTPSTRDIIIKMGDVNTVIDIPNLAHIDKNVISSYAEQFAKVL